MTIDSASETSFGSPVSFAIEDVPLSKPLPAWTTNIVPVGCDKTAVYSNLRLANANPVPSFISMSGTSPMQGIMLSGGTIAEAGMTYNFVVTATYEYATPFTTDFTFTVVVPLPCVGESVVSSIVSSDAVFKMGTLQASRVADINELGF